MNKEMKHSFRIFILKILAVVFVLCICYFLYAFVYRAKTELPTKAVVTNRGAAACIHCGTETGCFPRKRTFIILPLMGEEREGIWNICHSRAEEYQDAAHKKRCHSCHVYIHDASGTGGYRGLCAGQRLLHAHRNIIRSFM